MSRMTKQYQIDVLNGELSAANAEIARQIHMIEALEEKVEARNDTIKDLHNEIDRLIHTPEFAADTEAAFDRGRNEGVRSLASTANNYMYAMAEETVVHMNQLVNKYTRELTSQLFLGTVLPEELVRELPDTDFTKSLLDNLPKIDMLTSETEHTVQ